MGLADKFSLGILFITYGLFSTMMPQSLGVAELLIGVLLLKIISFNGAIMIFFPIKKPDYIAGAWLPNARILMHYLFLVPFITGIIQQNDFADMARDFISIFFLGFPVAMFCRLGIQTSTKEWVKWFAFGFLAIGASMSVRHFIDSDMSFDSIGNKLILSGNLPLVQDPSVQFALSFGLCMFLWLIVHGKILKAALMLAIAIVPLAAVLGAAARAPIAFALLSIMILYFVLIKKKFVSGLVLMLLLATILFLTIDLLLEYDFLSGSIDFLIQKTDQHGFLNSRDLEVQAVFEQTSTIGQILFGHGWGGIIKNPVLSGAYLRYVHNMFAYFYFKTGIVGFITFMCYCYIIFSHYLKGLKNSRGLDVVVLISLLSPLLVGSFFEATYKTMLFGFVLFMVIAISDKSQIKNGTNNNRRYRSYS